LENIDQDTGGFAEAKAQSGIADTDFQRITQWGECEELDFLPFEDSELGKSLNQRRFPGDGSHHGKLTGLEIAE
jgi:hypothetical protein